MADASWGPNETIALASVMIAVLSILVTGVISTVTIVLNHRRETALSRSAIEAERAKDYREDALGVLAAARNSASEARDLAKLTQPTSQDEVQIYLASTGAVFGASVLAQQSSQRIAILGWSDSVRSSAERLNSGLIGLGVSIKFPEMAMRIQVPETDMIVTADVGFWGRMHASLLSDIEGIEESAREFARAIAE